MGTLGVTILIPGPPFLLGTFQAGIIAGMGMYFEKDILEGPGIAFASLLFAIQFLWTALSGGVSLLTRPAGSMGSAQDDDDDVSQHKASKVELEEA
jgi:hypothetical protein